jgi:hypothetical protein
VTREDLIADVASTLITLNEKVREAVMLGKPGETAEYSSALNNVACAYSMLEPEMEDE